MKCQHCGTSEVNFHYSSNINGVVTERHLCTDCARALGYGNRMPIRAVNMLDNFFDSVFSAPAGFPPGALGFVTPVLFAPTPQMGILIQGGNETAAPDIPAQNTNIDDGMKKRREINVLREQMEQAVKSEDFERAIELRDEIKKLSAKE